MATGQENRDNQQSGVTQGAAGGQAAPEWDSLKGDVTDMASAAMEEGRHILDSAREQATGYVDLRKNDIAQSVVDLANTLRSSGSSFEDRPAIHAMVEGAAGGLEQLADRIKARSFADMFGDVEAMVRRQPAAAAVATMAAGFLLARFVKASSEGTRGGTTRSAQIGAAGRGQGQQQPGASSRGQAGV